MQLTFVRMHFLSMSAFVFLCVRLCEGKSIKGEKGGKGIKKEEHYKQILQEMKASYIQEDLRYLTEIPHHPGGKRNTKLGIDIAEKWKKSGFDKTEIFRYNIYMSYPMNPGKINLINNNIVENKLVIENEPPFDDSEKKGKLLYPFNAFSASGSVTGEVVYGNYGRITDYDVLESLGIEVSGKIMLVRYAKSSRTNKVLEAEKRGAIGVIIFTDPSDYSSPGQEYPNGWMVNEYGVQRGTINRLTGDALSLGYPAKPGYFRINETKYSGNPTIPSQPISYSTAYQIFKFMKNDSIPSPSDFQGGLNLTYVLSSGNDRKINLNVFTKLETRESLTVCSTLYGRKEPDRYIMLGNHRDSWTYGASDASSGTAAMIEIVRSLGHEVKKTGWRPHRSIMACSWGAEETGILGSTEWSDENHQFIKQKVVAYLNVDMAVEGNFSLRVKALEYLSKGIFDAAKLVSAPDDSTISLYDDYLAKSKILRNDDSLTEPILYTVSSGSDYRSLWHTYGTAIADYRYHFSKKDFPGLPTNGHYHTRYESFGWMSKFVDPKFSYHLAIGRFWAAHSLLIADATILPFDLVAYTKQVKFYLNQFEIAYKPTLSARKISLSFARRRLDVLLKKAIAFHKYIDELNLQEISCYQLRSINDKLMNFERNFILPGISVTLSARHVIYSTVRYKLKNTKFPGISEAIYFATKNKDDDWDEVRKHITLVVWCFDTATRSLDLGEWKN